MSKINFDPNLSLRGRITSQTVRFVFGKWEYRKSADVTVRGNLRGLEAIDGALENLWNETKDRSFVMSQGDNSLEESRTNFDDFKNLVISAEIIGLKKDEL